MMRKIFSVFIIFFIISINVFPQEPIDYHHKLVVKELRKTFDIDEPKLSEVHFNDSVSQHLKGKFFSVSHRMSHIGYCYIGRVKSCRAGGCSISGQNRPDLSFEYFDYVVVFNTDKTVLSVRIFNYMATHGQEVCSKGWLKQFIGYHGDKQLKVGKDIDAISGATISVYTITTDIENVSIYLNNNSKIQ